MFSFNSISKYPLNIKRGIAAICAALALSSCNNSTEEEPVFFPSENPVRLSDWQLFSHDGNNFRPNSATELFKPSNVLFTDYAHKMRTLWLPPSTTLTAEAEELSYPVGTVLSKTFYYPKNSAGQVLKENDRNLANIALADHKLIETRLLVRRESGWAAFPYVWNDEQSEAFLRVAGASESLTLVAAEHPQDITDFQYFVPNENQCAGCHRTEHPDGPLRPLGAKATQLVSMIPTLQKRNWIDAPTASLIENQARPAWQDQSVELEQRVVEYLNIHCGHCHNPDGAADTSGLNLDGSHNSLIEMGLCKPPVAAGGGSGDLRYGIVPGAATASILSYRLASEDPAVMMPELGRSLAHQEGVELVNTWIDNLAGSCANQ